MRERRECCYPQGREGVASDAEDHVFCHPARLIYHRSAPSLHPNCLVARRNRLPPLPRSLHRPRHSPWKQQPGQEHSERVEDSSDGARRWNLCGVRGRKRGREQGDPSRAGFQGVLLLVLAAKGQKLILRSSPTPRPATPPRLSSFTRVSSPPFGPNSPRPSLPPPSLSTAAQRPSPHSPPPLPPSPSPLSPPSSFPQLHKTTTPSSSSPT